MLEELCHRNAAFVIYHADQMPRIVLDELKVHKLADGVYTVTVALKDTRSIPTIAQQAVRHQIGLPDRHSLSGDDLTVAVGGPLVDRDTGEIAAVERDLHALRLENGFASHATLSLGRPRQGQEPRQGEIRVAEGWHADAAGHAGMSARRRA
jgi:hypothetical protein